MLSDVLQSYAAQGRLGDLSSGYLAYLANLENVARIAPDVARSIVAELRDQRSFLKLIASENYCSLAVQSAMANLLTDKYAEGVPAGRYYPGCGNVDDIEVVARDQACRLFGCDHAYVQAHSGADANLVAFWTILRARVEIPTLMELFGVEEASELPGGAVEKLSRSQWAEVRRRLGNQRLLAMDYSSGGHLTHGYRMNVSAKMFDPYSYTVSRETGRLDYDAIEQLAIQIEPTILLAGFSAYPRRIDFARMRAIADRVGAVFMVDMAHFAGLVAGRAFEGEYDPIPHAHIVTSTTHKTLRGPRGGLVLCNNEFAEHLDKGCPLVLGGPLPHVMAAKAICFTEALSEEFRAYAQKVIDNAAALAEALAETGPRVLTGGTENHLVLLDVTPTGLTGRQAEGAMRASGLTFNRNSIPFDSNTPWVTSGARLGTAAVTTLGMGPDEMREIAAIIGAVLAGTKPGVTKAGKPSKLNFVLDDSVRDDARRRVHALLQSFPLYPELDLEVLSKGVGLDAQTVKSGS